jgi:hypothetical protein
MRLENRQSFTGLVSSNLTLSAKLDRTAFSPLQPFETVRFWHSHIH